MRSSFEHSLALAHRTGWLVHIWQANRLPMTRSWEKWQTLDQHTQMVVCIVEQCVRLLVFVCLLFSLLNFPLSLPFKWAEEIIPSTRYPN